MYMLDIELGCIYGFPQTHEHTETNVWDTERKRLYVCVCEVSLHVLWMCVCVNACFCLPLCSFVLFLFVSCVWCSVYLPCTSDFSNEMAFRSRTVKSTNLSCPCTRATHVLTHTVINTHTYLTVWSFAHMMETHDKSTQPCYARQVYLMWRHTAESSHGCSQFKRFFSLYISSKRRWKDRKKRKMKWRIFDVISFMFKVGSKLLFFLLT